MPFATNGNAFCFKIRGKCKFSKKKDFKTRVFRASQKDAKSLRMYQLVTKMPFWAYAVGQVGKDFAAFVAISLFPLYMNR